MSDPVVDILMDKMEIAETRIDVQLKAMQEISGTVENMKDQTQNIIRVAGVVDQLEKQMTAVKFPVAEMATLGAQLRAHQQVLNNPAKQKVVHTADRLIWAVIILFILVVTLIIFLIDKNKELDQMTMNNITWRHLKLDSNPAVLMRLHQIEREYLAYPKAMKENVEKEELRRRQQEENRRLAAEKEQEMLEYKRKAGDLPDPDAAEKTK